MLKSELEALCNDQQYENIRLAASLKQLRIENERLNNELIKSKFDLNELQRKVIKLVLKKEGIQ